MVSSHGPTLEALVEVLPEGGWRVRSPRVGVYRGCPRVGSRRAAGEPVGRLTVLNRTEDLLLPAGVDGLVTSVAVHDPATPVEYEQDLFALCPPSAPPKPGGRRRGRAPSQSSTPASLPAGRDLPPGCHAVAAPIDGVFYRAPSPGAAHFVSAGDIVETGRTLGLIEAMKSFNAVIYGGPGLPDRAVVVEARAADGSEVRQGAVLIVVRPSTT